MLDSHAEIPSRCDWRQHAFAFTPCGHVACLTCHPERFELTYACEPCGELDDVRQELLDVYGP